jgi:type II secretory pathway pseudopilin PulG
MKFFTRKELFAVILIFSAIILASLSNFKVSLRRARDVQRKNDIRMVADALALYTADFGAFPLSEDGKIVACQGPETKIDEKGRITGLTSCGWGKDPLADISDPSYSPYKDRLPQDPLFEKGYRYLYLSNGNRFQLYSSLEGADEAEYDSKIVARNLSCGSYICNFGLGYGATPLDKSLEEYENELLRQK